jgi:AAHS family 4-hydroxybenzoate transporter-like MFS transporter
MTERPVVAAVDVSQLLDERGMSRFNVWLVIFAFFIVLFDGYDITAMGFAAPLLIKAWHITDQAALGRVLGASILGMLIGSPIFGYIGDRYGRRVALISSMILFGALTWATVLATSLQHLLALRFLAGIGIGGLMPNIVALTAEFAPRQYRATMIIVMFTGVAFGGGLPGPVAALLAPHYGWQILFVVGGCIPILVGMACALWLPESIKFLAIKEGRQQDALKLLARLRPDKTFGPDTKFAIRDEGRQAASSISPKHLFEGGLAWITPVLWLLFICNLMGYMFLMSWTPVLLSSLRMPVSKAAVANSLFQLGGAIGGWVLARPMDKYGVTPMKVISTISIPAVALIGFLGTVSLPLLLVLEFFAGFCVLSLQFGLNAISGMIYPTSVRSVGSGWALAIGRVGSVFGPVVGGILIAKHLSVPQLYLFAAIPFVITAIACFTLGRLFKTRFQSASFSQAQAAKAVARS